MTDAQTEAREIARLEFTCPDCDPYVVETNLGRYVRYADHATALAAKDAELEKVKAECDKWREAFGEMHRQTMRAEASLVEKDKALDLIAEGRPDNPIGDPWAFYDNLVTVARRALEACGTTEAIEAVAASLSGTPPPIPGDTPK